MNELKLAQIVANRMEAYKNNSVIMEFVTNEALAQVSSQIASIPGRVCTPAAVKVLIQSKANGNIKARVDEYIQAGLYGVVLASFQKVA